MFRNRKNFELKDYLNDVLDMIADVKKFTEDLSFEDFKKDKKSIFAVIRCLEVIGEASKQIPNTLKKKYGQIPWEDIEAMRNKLIHEYFGADVNIIWGTIQEDLKPLEKAVKKIIADTNK